MSVNRPVSLSILLVVAVVSLLAGASAVTVYEARNPFVSTVTHSTTSQKTQSVTSWSTVTSIIEVTESFTSSSYYNGPTYSTSSSSTNQYCPSPYSSQACLSTFQQGQVQNLYGYLPSGNVGSCVLFYGSDGGTYSLVNLPNSHISGYVTLTGYFVNYNYCGNPTFYVTGISR